jgi:diaminopropionate ammonia-lyase
VQFDAVQTWYQRPAARSWTCPPAPAEVTAFHSRLPGYAPTPLVELLALAAELGVGRVFAKDESERLGLPAFKVLGASWAVCCLLCARAGVPPGGADLDRLRALALALAPQPKLITATEGNHGRAVARMARLLRLPADVYLPSSVPPAAAAAIAAEGANVIAIDAAYDEAIARAAEAAAADPGSELVQDTAWAGYRRITRWIVQGYSTLFREIDAQLHAAAAEPATLVAVPVGVGSLAQAAVTHYRSRPGTPSPSPASVLGVEPTAAACVLASLRAGEPISVSTTATVMTGVNCGTPSSLAWPCLRAGMDAAVAVADEDATLAVGDLARLGVRAGPSGAAALAGARAALTGLAGVSYQRIDAEDGVDLAPTLPLTSADHPGTPQPFLTGGMARPSIRLTVATSCAPSPTERSPWCRRASRRPTCADGDPYERKPAQHRKRADDRPDPLTVHAPGLAQQVQPLQRPHGAGDRQ